MPPAARLRVLISSVRRRVATFLLVSLVVVPGPVLATSAPASAAVGTRLDGTRGGSAVAELTVVDGCRTRTTFVFATTLVLRPRTPSDPYAQVAVQTVDACTGEASVLFGVVDPVVLRQSDARVARVVGEVELVDDATGTSAGVHQLDVALEAVGRPDHGHGGYVQRWEGGQTVYRAVGTFAEATASGSLVSPDGTDLLAGQTGTGSLDWSTSVQVTLERP